MSNDTLIKINAAADILGGTIFFANDEGFDPEYNSNGGLLPNGMYIRLIGSDSSIAYISAYEINKKLADLDAITRTKANKDDLDTLKEQVDNKLSSADVELLFSEQLENLATKTDITTLTTSLSNKADAGDVSTLTALVELKANQSAVTELSSALENKANATVVEELTASINAKANSSDVTSIRTDITTLQNVVKTLTDSSSVNSINAQIEHLNNELNKKLTADDLSDITSDISYLGEDIDSIMTRIDNVETNLNKKVSETYVQSQLNDVNNTIRNIVTTVEGKADKTDVKSKANQSDLENVTKKVAELNTSVSNINNSVSNNYTELLGLANSKADKATVEEQLLNINNTLPNKADKLAFNNAIERINSKLNILENLKDNISSEVLGEIEELECEFNNIVAEVRASINAQTKTLTQYDKTITSLQTASDSYKEKIKQNWVRVLTTTEYKNLRIPPEGALYNDRYKYPNIVYLIVDFNKPKAIYIGDILVAKAEQNGSVGFAYTFPLSF